MLEIYQYQKASTFIRDAWVEKKTKNSSFSMRSWSKQLGFANNAPLSLMLAGKRSIPKKYLPRIVTSLGLSVTEAIYLESLVEFENAKSLQQKQFYLDRLAALSPAPSFDFHEIESFKALGDPIHMAILEMTDLRNFRSDPEWIKNQLCTRMTTSEIKDCIDRLLHLGLLKKEARGRLVKTHKHLTNHPDIADIGSQEYHKNVSILASQEVALQDVQDREFNGYSINIQKSSIPKAKKLIRDFIRDFASQMEASPATGDETYQLNVQFFSLFQSKRKSK